MKSVKLIAVIATAFFLISGNGNCQLLVDNFDYPAGDLLTNNGWSSHSGAGTQAVTVNSGGLSFPGYNLSGIGNSALLDNNGEDVNRTFTQQTSGAVYAAFMINVQSVSAGYFLHFAGNPVGSTYRGKVFVDATNHFGVSFGSNTGTFTTSTFITNSTYLLVLKYEIVAGVSNDLVSLFVFNSNPPSTEPSTPAVGPLSDATLPDLNPASFALRQYSTTQNYLIDGIRIAGTWADVIGVQVTAPDIQSHHITFSNVTGSSMSASWTKGNGEKRVCIVNNSPVITPPTDGTDPTSNTIFQGSGQQVVYNGSDSLVAVSGLSSSTTYWFQVFEYNGTGINTMYSPATGVNNPMSQATQFVLGPPVLSPPSSSAITTQNAVLGATISSDGGSPIIERGTVWSINSPVTISDNKLAEGGTSAGTFSHLRTGLPAGTEVFFAAYAQNSVGTSLSQESALITLAEEPSNQASLFKSPLASHSAATVSWEDNNGIQPATGFLIKGNTTGIFTAPVDGAPETDDLNLSDGTTVVNIAAGNNTYTWTSLAPSTTYYFAIYPYSNAGAIIDYKTSASTPVTSVTTTAVPVNTYTWTGADNADWTQASNWSPARTTPEAADILLFNDGSTKTIASVPTQTVSRIVISANTKITLQTTSPAILTIAGGSGTDLDIASGSELNLAGANAITLSVASTANAAINGNMTFTGGAHRLTGGASGSVYFNSGSAFRAGTAFTGNAFGTAAPYNAIVFDNGSTYICQAGSNPFGAAAPNSVVVFQPNSLFKVIAGVTAAFSGRTYGNFQLDAPGATLTQTGTGAVSLQNLDIISGTLNFNMTGTAGHSIKGSITVSPGATLSFSPTAAGTVQLNGTATQVISGGGTITTNSFHTLSLGNTAGINLASDMTINGLLVLNGCVMNLGAGNLSLGSAAQISGSFSAGNMITVAGSGMLKKEFSLTGDSFLFPVGDNIGTIEYSPVFLSMNSGTFTAGNYVGVNLVNSAHPLVPPGGSNLLRYWNLTSGGISSFICDAVFSYNSPSDVSGLESDICCMNMTPSPFVVGTTNTSSHQLLANGMTALGSFTGAQPAKNLGVKVLLEGLYSGNGQMGKAQNSSGDQFPGSIADQVVIELHSAVPGDFENVIYSSGYVNLGTNGELSLSVPSNLNSSYYLVVKHRNSIETISALPVSFSGNLVSYDFTDNSAKAKGNNLKPSGDGYYLVYCGDVNQDGLLDGDDMIQVDNDSANLLSGYNDSDLNGDGQVNETDVDLLTSNSSSFISVKKP